MERKSFRIITGFGYTFGCFFFLIILFNYHPYYWDNHIFFLDFESSLIFRNGQPVFWWCETQRGPDRAKSEKLFFDIQRLFSGDS